MITHEEARKIALDMLPKQIGSISSRNKVNKYFELENYFKQQETQSKRLEKVEELLGLYRECNKEGVFWLDIQQRIAKLEKELEGKNENI